MVDTSNIQNAVTDVSLPDFFPQQNLVVEQEQHLFNVFQQDYSTEPQIRYQLNKAPVDEIIRVTGTYEGSTIEFTKGEDYTLSTDNTEIVWDESNRIPAAGTTFFVTYESDSILKRYLLAANDENEVTQEAIVESINSKFIETASGDDLDRIGAIFGEIVGARRGRTDGDYRAYLQSVVQSFVSRGTVPGLKLAISAATGVPTEDITIEENFENNEYQISVIPQTPVTGTTIEEIAEIADPSGVKQIRTRFTPQPDEIKINDIVSLTEGFQSSDSVLSADTVSSNRRNTQDYLGSDESIEISPNKFAPQPDVLFGSDSVSIDDNRIDSGVDEIGTNDISTSRRRDSGIDKSSSEDTIDVDTEKPQSRYWQSSSPSEKTNWSFFEWTKLEEVDRTLSDTAGSSDAVTNITEAIGPIWDSRDWNNFNWETNA